MMLESFKIDILGPGTGSDPYTWGVPVLSQARPIWRNNMFKKPKCASCEMQEKIIEAKDGDIILISKKCVGCSYLRCNIEQPLKDK